MWYGEVDIMKSPTLSSNDSSAQLRSCDFQEEFSSLPQDTQYACVQTQTADLFPAFLTLPDAGRRRFLSTLSNQPEKPGTNFYLGRTSAASESFWLVIDQRALKISVWNRIRISLRLFFSVQQASHTQILSHCGQAQTGVSAKLETKTRTDEVGDHRGYRFASMRKKLIST